MLSQTLKRSRRSAEDKSATRTAEQSEIGRYWYESSPQGWNRIAREVLAARQFDVWENARLFALLNLAMADGYIAGFDSKYYCNYWRPVTAIREGGDSEWLSYLPTPPVPDYPSTHTVEGAAAAAVMARFFNTDFISFSMTSGGAYPGITRKFWSFSEAAREWCVPCPLRNSLLDRCERRVCPGRTHWGMGFRKRIAARKASAGDDCDFGVGKAAH